MLYNCIALDQSGSIAAKAISSPPDFESLVTLAPILTSPPARAAVPYAKSLNTHMLYYDPAHPAMPDRDLVRASHKRWLEIKASPSTWADKDAQVLLPELIHYLQYLNHTNRETSARMQFLTRKAWRRFRDRKLLHRARAMQRYIPSPNHPAWYMLDPLAETSIIPTLAIHVYQAEKTFDYNVYQLPVDAAPVSIGARGDATSSVTSEASGLSQIVSTPVDASFSNPTGTPAYAANELVDRLDIVDLGKGTASDSAL